MWPDFRASFLARNLASPCLGREPKAKVATKIYKGILTSSSSWAKHLNHFKFQHILPSLQPMGVNIFMWQFVHIFKLIEKTSIKGKILQ
jgi:hypothetical protein